MFLITVQLATHYMHSLCPKAAVQDTLCTFPNKANRCEALYAARLFIILLNAFNKVMASVCSDGSTRWCCLYVCTTLITSVMFVYFSRCVRFWQRRSIIAFYSMRGSWFNMMKEKKKKKKKHGLFPNQLLVNWSSREQTPVPPTSCSTCTSSPCTCRWHGAPRFHLR